MPEQPWVDGQTFADVLDRTVAGNSGRPAVVFPGLGRRWSYREFHDVVRATARGLLALGVQHGEHVGIWATNWPEWIALQFAAASVGAVLVNALP